MSKPKKSYICTECQHKQNVWSGQCKNCQAWSTIEEDESASQVSSRAVGVKSAATATAPTRKASRVKDVTTDRHSHTSTGIGELDRVLGGGTVQGGVILLAGEPGAGKSTLVSSVAHKVAERGNQVLIVSSEEAVEQIALRAVRIGATSDNIFIASETELSKTLGHVEDVNPDFLIVDSLQTMASEAIEARAGSVSQVIEVATVLTRMAKEMGIPLVLIGQVTKDGSIAGPRIVEHLVDVVLHFEGDSDSPLRILRGVKNRYGPADEMGCFQHTENGIEEVPDPSGLLLGRRDVDVVGTATTVVMEGRRPLPLEVQALALGSVLPVPRKAVSGLDTNRTVMVQAIMERQAGVRLGDKDVYVSTMGGIRSHEPALDLAVGLALDSSVAEYAIPHTMVVIGEMALSGEVRSVTSINRRLQEAFRLGFTHALVGDSDGIKPPDGMKVTTVRSIRDATSFMRNLTGATEG